MTDRAAGLTFNEAFEQALAEEEAAASNEAPSAEGELGPNSVEEDEQSAVETEEEAGVFAGLESDQDGDEQSDLRNSLHQVKVRGQVQEVAYDELINGYQRHADYTQGKQELAAKEEEYNKAIMLWEALESDYVGTVQKLMSRAGLQGQVKPGPKQESMDIDTLVEQKLQEKLQSDPRLQRFEQEQSLRQLEILFSEVEREFNLPTLSDADKQLMLTKAQQWDTTDLKYVAWRLLQEKQQREVQRENAELTSTSKGRRSGAVEDYEPHVEYYSTVAEAWQAALAEEGNLQ